MVKSDDSLGVVCLGHARDIYGETCCRCGGLFSL